MSQPLPSRDLSWALSFPPLHSHCPQRPLSTNQRPSCETGSLPCETGSSPNSPAVAPTACDLISFRFAFPVCYQTAVFVRREKIIEAAYLGREFITVTEHNQGSRLTFSLRYDHSTSFVLSLVIRTEFAVNGCSWHSVYIKSGQECFRSGCCHPLPEVVHTHHHQLLTPLPPIA